MMPRCHRTALAGQAIVRNSLGPTCKGSSRIILSCQHKWSMRSTRRQPVPIYSIGYAHWRLRRAGTTQLLSMSDSQPQRAFAYPPTCLQSSPAGQLFTWVTKSLLNDKDSHADPSSRNDERNGSRRDVVDEEASTTTSGAIEVAPGEEYPAEVEALRDTKEQTSQDGRHNEAHDWILTRRIVVAGIICLYT
jgi:hypothetical protein